MNMHGTCVPKECLRGRKRPEASSAPRMAKRGHPLANFIPLRDGQLALLEESYAALLRSVNEALVLQTRLKGYMDSIGLAVDEGGIRLDYAALGGMLAERQALVPRDAYGDVVDLLRTDSMEMKSRCWRDGVCAKEMWGWQRE